MSVSLLRFKLSLPTRFPSQPNDQGIMKFALHRAGYLSDTGVPRTVTDHGAMYFSEQNAVGMWSLQMIGSTPVRPLIKGIGWISRESYQALREQMTIVYPKLANCVS